MEHSLSVGALPVAAEPEGKQARATHSQPALLDRFPWQRMYCGETESTLYINQITG